MEIRFRTIKESLLETKGMQVKEIGQRLALVVETGSMIAETSAKLFPDEDSKLQAACDEIFAKAEVALQAKIDIRAEQIKTEIAETATPGIIEDVIP